MATFQVGIGNEEDDISVKHFPVFEMASSQWDVIVGFENKFNNKATLDLRKYLHNFYRAKFKFISMFQTCSVSTCHESNVYLRMRQKKDRYIEGEAVHTYKAMYLPDFSCNIDPAFWRMRNIH